MGALEGLIVFWGALINRPFMSWRTGDRGPEKPARASAFEDGSALVKQAPPAKRDAISRVTLCVMRPMASKGTPEKLRVRASEGVHMQNRESLRCGTRACSRRSRKEDEVEERRMVEAVASLMRAEHPSWTDGGCRAEAERLVGAIAPGLRTALARYVRTGERVEQRGEGVSALGVQALTGCSYPEALEVVSVSLINPSLARAMACRRREAR